MPKRSPAEFSAALIGQISWFARSENHAEVSAWARHLRQHGVRVLNAPAEPDGQQVALAESPPALSEALLHLLFSGEQVDAYESVADSSDDAKRVLDFLRGIEVCEPRAADAHQAAVFSR